MSDSEQKIGRDGTGYQAGNDLTINNGLSADQMSEVMIALSGQLANYFYEARETQEKRFHELRISILDSFANSDNAGNTEAFSDPDFQYAVKEAHDTYARSGSEDLRGELVRLITERSRHSSNTRLAKILNSAISISGQLGREEFSAISVAFVVINVVSTIPSSDFIVPRYKTLLTPFIDSLPSTRSSFDYLASLGLVSLNAVMNRPLETVLGTKYDHALSAGFRNDDLENVIYSWTQEDQEDPLKVSFQEIFQDILFKIDGSLRFRSGSDEDFSLRLQQRGFPPKLAKRLEKLRAEHKISSAEVMDVFRNGFPEFRDIELFWQNSNAEQIDVSMLGKAVAHSALTGSANLNAPLEIWVN